MPVQVRTHTRTVIYGSNVLDKGRFVLVPMNPIRVYFEWTVSILVMSKIDKINPSHALQKMQKL